MRERGRERRREREGEREREGGRRTKIKDEGGRERRWRERE